MSWSRATLIRPARRSTLRHNLHQFTTSSLLNSTKSTSCYFTKSSTVPATGMTEGKYLQVLWKQIHLYKAYLQYYTDTKLSCRQTTLSYCNKHDRRRIWQWLWTNPPWLSCHWDIWSRPMDTNARRHSPPLYRITVANGCLWTTDYSTTAQ